MARFIGRCLALLCLLAAVPGAHGADDYVAIYSTVGEFYDVKENLTDAITNRGLVINNVSHVGEMLDRTGKDLGATKQIFVHGDVLEFCSARVSRQTMEADPHNLVFCPYTISVYALPAEPRKVYVSYRRPLRRGPHGAPQVLGPVDKLLHDIVQQLEPGDGSPINKNGSAATALRRRVCPTGPSRTAPGGALAPAGQGIPSRKIWSASPSPYGRSSDHHPAYRIVSGREFDQ